MLATGGGIVSEPVTFDLILSSFYTIWLKAEPEEHMARVRKQGDLRPMADDKTAMAELITILSSREPLYARARTTLDTSGAKQDESLKRLLAMIYDCVSGCPWQSRSRQAGQSGSRAPSCADSSVFAGPSVPRRSGDDALPTMIWKPDHRRLRAPASGFELFFEMTC